MKIIHLIFFISIFQFFRNTPVTQSLKKKRTFKQMNPFYVKKIIENYPKNHKLFMFDMGKKRQANNQKQYLNKRNVRKQKIKKFYNKFLSRKKFIDQQKGIKKLRFKKQQIISSNKFHHLKQRNLRENILNKTVNKFTKQFVPEQKIQSERKLKKIQQQIQALNKANTLLDIKKSQQLNLVKQKQNTNFKMEKMFGRERNLQNLKMNRKLPITDPQINDDDMENMIDQIVDDEFGDENNEPQQEKKSEEQDQDQENEKEENDKIFYLQNIQKEKTLGYILQAEYRSILNLNSVFEYNVVLSHNYNYEEDLQSFLFLYNKMELCNQLTYNRSKIIQTFNQEKIYGNCSEQLAKEFLLLVNVVMFLKNFIIEKILSIYDQKIFIENKPKQKVFNEYIDVDQSIHSVSNFFDDIKVDEIDDDFFKELSTIQLFHEQLLKKDDFNHLFQLAEKLNLIDIQINLEYLKKETQLVADCFQIIQDKKSNSIESKKGFFSMIEKVARGQSIYDPGESRKLMLTQTQNNQTEQKRVENQDGQVSRILLKTIKDNKNNDDQNKEQIKEQNIKKQDELIPQEQQNEKERNLKEKKKDKKEKIKKVKFYPNYDKKQKLMKDEEIFWKKFQEEGKKWLLRKKKQQFKLKYSDFRNQIINPRFFNIKISIKIHTFHDSSNISLTHPLIQLISKLNIRLIQTRKLFHNLKQMFSQFSSHFHLCHSNNILT